MDETRGDGALLRAWREGERQAGNLLFERHFASLFRFFATKVSDGIEDLIQTTFLACVEGRDRIENDAHFRAYMFGTARRQLMSRFRRRRRQREVAEEIPFSSIHDGGPSPSYVARQRQETRLLLEALRRIGLDFQIALELHYWEHLSTNDIAQILELPHGTLKSRLRRARELLRIEMEALAESRELLESTLGGLEGWARELRDELTVAAPEPPIDTSAS